MHEHPRHAFRPDDRTHRDVSLADVIGHRQVTSAYLVELARTHGGRLATFDADLAGLHGYVVEPEPTA